MEIFWLEYKFHGDFLEPSDELFNPLTNNVPIT